MNFPTQTVNNPPRGLLLAACGRPNLLLPAWLSAATGAALTNGSQPSTVPLIIVTLAFSLVLCAIHAANLIADRHSDRINGKNSFWQERLPATVVARHAAGWALLGLLLSGWAHWHFLLPTAATLVLGFIYSLPPIRLSARWGWDLLANVLGYGLIAPWWGSMVAHWEPSVTSPALAVPWSAVALLGPLIAIVFIWTTILDVKGDRLSGKTTIAVRFSLNAERHRPLLLTGIFAGVLAAGIPGLVSFPPLGVICVVWFILAYGLAHRVGQSTSGD